MDVSLHLLLIMLQTTLEKTENEILELSQNAVNLKSNFLELTELTHVLEKTETFFSEQEDISGRDSLTHALISEDTVQTAGARGRLGSVYDDTYFKVRWHHAPSSCTLCTLMK